MFFRIPVSVRRGTDVSQGDGEENGNSDQAAAVARVLNEGAFGGSGTVRTPM